MKPLVFFVGISNLPLASQNNLCHIIWTSKKYLKSIPNNNVTFHKVGDDFNYETNYINQKII
jgi:hypothetical protein